MAEKPLKRFDRPLMRVSLSDLILVTIIFYYSRGRVMNGMSIASWANYIGTNVLLGGEYADWVEI